MNTDHEENLILHSLLDTMTFNAHTDAENLAFLTSVNIQLLKENQALKADAILQTSLWKAAVEERVKDLTFQRDAALEENEALSKQRDDVLEDLKFRKEELIVVRSDCEEARDQKKMMQETFSKGFDTWAGYWKVKATTLAEDLDKAQRDRFELAGQVEARDVEINRLAHANITTHDEVAGFLDEIHDLKEVTEIKCRLIGTLHAEIDRVRGEWRVAHAANDHLVGQHMGHIKIIQDLEHRLAKAESINAGWRSNYDAKLEECIALQIKLSKLSKGL